MASIARAGQFLPGLYGPLTLISEVCDGIGDQIGRVVMRILGPNGPTAATGKSSVRRSASGTFSLPQDEEAPAAPSGASGVATLSGIDALIALQGIESATDRRRRAVSRGKSALDALDDLKLALLSGSLDLSAADRLQTIALGLTDSSGDPDLDRVLAEIELRVAVELAKMEAVSA